MLRRRALLLLPSLVALWGCAGLPSSRDIAWRRLQAAMDSHNDLEAVRACEAYLADIHAPDRDAVRTAQVRRAYGPAFMRWLMALPGKPNAGDMKHIHQFQTLMGAFSSWREKP